MTQEELLQTYDSIIDSFKIYYFQPARHFHHAMKFYQQLQDGVADPKNFFTETMTVYDETDPMDREPDFTSGSGSQYWYSKEGVVRCSDHWGNGVARCDWALHQKNGKTVYGYDVDCTVHMKKRTYAFSPWDRFVFKAKKIEINGKPLITTFANTVCMDLVQWNGKVYQRVVIESYQEYSDKKESV